jgi:hypothetical protein
VQVQELKQLLDLDTRPAVLQVHQHLLSKPLQQEPQLQEQLQALSLSGKPLPLHCCDAAGLLASMAP